MAVLRLDKLLGSLGYGSRRELAALAKAGKLTVNGQPCTDPGRKVDPETDAVAVAGNVVRQGPPHLYLLLNKPAGVITATRDPLQPTVLSLLPEQLRRTSLFPVGRLDKDTQGLLLLTTDGDFGHALTAPRRHVAKVYEATVSGALDPDAERRFANGLPLADGTVCRPAELTTLRQDGETAIVRITLYEGRFHQVKRMVRAVGGQVESLRRVAFGPLSLDGSLAPGAFRDLTPEEVRALREAAQNARNGNP